MSIVPSLEQYRKNRLFKYVFFFLIKGTVENGKVPDVIKQEYELLIKSSNTPTPSEFVTYIQTLIDSNQLPTSLLPYKEFLSLACLYLIDDSYLYLEDNVWSIIKIRALQSAQRDLYIYLKSCFLK